MLKDKPLGFQIWLAMTLLMLFVAFSVTVIMIWLLEDHFGGQIPFANADLAGKLVRLVISFVILNIVFAKIMASRITEPIRYLERRVRYIANRDWSVPIKVDRKDEIGKLAMSIGRMQENLKRMEAEEEAFLQTISHDLKTPVMIIRSYCQAMQDGVYLEGSPEKMLQVVESEALRLEEKIKKLLFLNSLDFELQRSGKNVRIDLRELIEAVLARFSFRRREISVVLQPGTAWIEGLPDKLEVAFENIVDNGLRYAASSLEIEILSCADRVVVRVSNDGERMEEEVQARLFQRCFKGKKGNYGLGLYIAKRIIDHHCGEIWAESLDGKICFNMSFPGLQDVALTHEGR